MTPYLNPASRVEERYNTAHAKTRVLIEQTFGRWKRRFHVLHGEVRMRPERVCTIIGACDVLHNIAVIMNEPMDDDPLDDDVVEIDHYQGPQRGLVIRDHIRDMFIFHNSMLPITR